MPKPEFPLDIDGVPRLESVMAKDQKPDGEGICFFCHKKKVVRAYSTGQTQRHITLCEPCAKSNGFPWEIGSHVGIAAAA